MFDRIYDILIAGGAWITILNGLWATVKISALSLLLGTILGALDTRQIEATRTLGFFKQEAFWLITLPQTIQNAKPVYQSIVVNLIQWTSVVGYVTITDLTRVVNNIAARTM